LKECKATILNDPALPPCFDVNWKAITYRFTPISQNIEKAKERVSNWVKFINL